MNRFTSTYVGRSYGEMEDMSKGNESKGKRSVIEMLPQLNLPIFSHTLSFLHSNSFGTGKLFGFITRKKALTDAYSIILRTHIAWSR